MERVRLYATDGETGKKPGADAWFPDRAKPKPRRVTQRQKKLVPSALPQGIGVKPGQRVVYVDGGFDLFSSGHIEFLRSLVVQRRRSLREPMGSIRSKPWTRGEGKEDYGPVYVVAGVHDDDVINHWKGVNYPIMNIYERGLCVLHVRVGTLTLVRAPGPSADKIQRN